MRRSYLVLLFAVAALAGCSKKHPAKVFVDPEMNSGEVANIAVFPFASAVHHTDDPDGVAPRTMDELFRNELDKRNDYLFSSPTSVDYALRNADMSAHAEAFVERFRKTGEIDKTFLADAAGALGTDAILIGVVDLWQEDEVDYRENAAPATYVGATITIIATGDGKILFQAKDENFTEGARSEERAVQTSGLGAVRRDEGARVYDAPDPREVASKVARALAASIPVR